MKTHYGAIDGLRAYAAIGIIMMHIAANSTYSMTGFIYQRFIPAFTDFVFLFMMISAFGLSCGYYNKVINNTISFPDFYKKRFGKILPFFGCLVLLDLTMSPSVDSVYEAFADLTLMFGFLPNAGNISVIGVGWFLGVIFVFYLVFPFFCFLLENKKRAWFSFFYGIIFSCACAGYFNIGRTNILYCSPFFIAGGLIFLYKEKIELFNKWLVLVALLLSGLLYFLLPFFVMKCLFVSISFLIFAIVNDNFVLNNKVTHFISGISMEMYLSHMVVFRIVEKLHINKLIGNGWGQYVITVFCVISGTIIFSVIFQVLLQKLKIIYQKQIERRLLGVKK